MSYPSYGQPPPQGGGYYQQQPPQQGGYYQQPNQGYQQPPPIQGYGQYGAPPPQSYAPQQGGYYQQPQQGYSQPPPQQYGGPSPQPYGNAPYGAPPPPQGQGQYGYQQQPQGYQQPPPQGQGQYGYQQQPQGYQQPPPQQQYPQLPPSSGYGPRMIINWNGDADADALRKAMKGFGTDEKTLIRVLANKDPDQIATIRDAYQRIHRRNLEVDIKSEVSGWFETGLLQIVQGPLMADVHLLRASMSGPGTKEMVLNDVLLGRSNADINAIKNAYHQTFHRRLEDDVRSDLSFKTERHFMIVLSAQRQEGAPVVPFQVQNDVNELYNATEGKVGTDEIKVCSILTTRNDDQIRAIAFEYKNKFARSLEDCIRKEFSGHMEDALLYQLRHGMDKYMHQAQLLEDACAGMGTKDLLLISRIVRAHWDRTNMANVRGAYEQRFRKNLAQRIKGETSGDYERLMLACIGESV